LKIPFVKDCKEQFWFT